MTKRKPKREKGVALVAVIVAITIVTLVTTEFSYNTNLDYAAAANARDEMKAHFLARSAMNISRMVIKVQTDILDKYRRYIGDLQIAEFVPMLIGVFGGSKDEVQSMADSFGLGAESSFVQSLGLKEGAFDLEVRTEDGMINLNCAGGSIETQKRLAGMLANLFAPNVYDPLFQNEDGDGQYTDRATFISAIIDFIDRDEAAYGVSGTPEEYGYQSRNPPYSARNNYLDSVDELRLVRGMDDAKWALFGDAFTIFGDCSVNISATSDINVIASIIAASAKSEEDPVLQDPMRLWALSARVAQAKMFGITFDKLKDFADFVKDPNGGLDALAELTGGSEASTQALAVEGVVLDNAKLSKVARTGSRRTYRIIARASVGRVEKTINAVWDTRFQNQNNRDPELTRGNWVYWREE